MLAHFLFLVSSESFFWIDLGIVTWQVEQLQQSLRSVSELRYFYTLGLNPKIFIADNID